LFDAAQPSNRREQAGKFITFAPTNRGAIMIIQLAARTDKLVMQKIALKQIPTKMATAPRLPVRREEDYREGKTMRIVSRGMAITIAALSFAGSASAAPVETVLYTFAGAATAMSPTLA
jgi:hypothetical protein